VYDDQDHVDRCLNKLKSLPPLVSVSEIENLRQQLAEVSEGKRFLLQGGDCAEIFEYCSEDPIQNKLRVLLQMSLVLTWGGRIPVVRVARMAGQYAKPRSKPTEIINGKEIPAFRGDNVNGFDVSDRTPNPDRLVQAYFHSAATMNFVRGLLNGDFASLKNNHNWDMSLSHVRSPSIKAEYEGIVNRMTDAMDFFRVIGADDQTEATTKTVDMFMSHEGLLLDYEQQLTRKCGDRYYNMGTHFLWIGDRTRQLDGGHVEYFRGLSNPVGIKVGPSMKPEELIALIKLVDPNNEPGRVTLITRYGYDKIYEHLPGHLDAVKEAGLKVVWCCDPMHGNTKVTEEGIKTRVFDNIAEELSRAFRIHKQRGSRLGGVHFELTGDSKITECMGGSMELSSIDLRTNYKTFCDPRLNYEQSLDIAFLIAKYYEKERSKLPGL